MKTLTIAFTAGQLITFEGAANYFQLLETSSGVDLEFQRNGATVAYAIGMEFGYAVKPEDGFNSFTIKSASAQTIKAVVGNGDGSYNRNSGVVQIIGQQGVFIQNRVSLTNVNQVLIAADLTRKYLFVQNNDAVAVMRLKVDGTAALVGAGIRIQPGGSYEPVGFMPTGAINAIMETATAAVGNCEFVTE
jgi:hypothetical protein